jgi:hypothetical protein
VTLRALVAAFAAAAALAASAGAAVPPGTAAPSRPMRLVGKILVLRYASGLAVRATYASGTELRWEALSGPSAGRTGREEIDAVEVAPDVYFVSWLEKDGTSVSNVLDLKAMRVKAFVTYDTGSGRQRLFDEGTVEEERPPPKRASP